MTIKVPFFDWAGLYNERAEDFQEVISTTLSKGAFVLQNEVEEFETKLKAFTGANYAVALSDGTNALLLGLRASGLKIGDEVILPSHSFIAAAQSIYHAGGVPVPVDMDLDDWLISPAAVESAITSKTTAIMPVHVNGRICKMDKIMEIAARYNLEVYEDAAQAMGAKFEGRGAGTIGRWGTYSFYPSKTLGCFGDAGALVTNDFELYETVKAMRNHGANDEKAIPLDISRWGTNCRMDNVHAAVLSYKMDYYDKALARRRKIANHYNKALKNIEGISLPPSPDANPRWYDIYQNYEICCKERDSLRGFLAKNGVGTIVQWGGFGIHQLGELGMSAKADRTENFFKESLLLPLNHILEDEQVDHVINLCIRFFQGKV